MIRTYSELLQYSTFEDRFKYLKLNGEVGQATFGYDRYINQKFYQSAEWKRLRDKIIIRDNGCDLAVPGYEMQSHILIHHMNPIQVKDISEATDFLMDPEYLICVSHNTHNAIHYSDEKLLVTGPIERRPNDMCPWRK